MPETMKLLGSTKSKITKNENGENVPHLEITEVILIHCNIVNNDYQQDSIVLYTFVLNKSFGQLLDISLKISIFLKTFNSEFSYIEVWFTNQKFRGFRKYKKSFLLRKHKKFFRGFCFLNHKKFSQGGFLLFFELGVESAGLYFQKYKKSFLLREYKKFFQSRFF